MQSGWGCSRRFSKQAGSRKRSSGTDQALALPGGLGAGPDLGAGGCGMLRHGTPRQALLHLGSLKHLPLSPHYPWSCPGDPGHWPSPPVHARVARPVDTWAVLGSTRVPRHVLPCSWLPGCRCVRAGRRPSGCGAQGPPCSRPRCHGSRGSGEAPQGRAGGRGAAVLRRGVLLPLALGTSAPFLAQPRPLCWTPVPIAGALGLPGEWGPHCRSVSPSTPPPQAAAVSPWLALGWGRGPKRGS